MEDGNGPGGVEKLQLAPKTPLFADENIGEGSKTACPWPFGKDPVTWLIPFRLLKARVDLCLSASSSSVPWWENVLLQHG